MARTRKGTVEIVFRGIDVEVHYEDGGYEPDINARELNWWFADDSLDEDDVTEEEEQTILDAIEDALNDDDDGEW